MRGKKAGPRIATLIIILAVVFAMFAVRLVQIQIVDIEDYRSLQGLYQTRTVSIASTRGEIYDRNGVPLVPNRVSYNIILDKAFIDGNKLNDVILNLVLLMQERGEEWNDGLVISTTRPFSFTEEGAKSDRLKNFLSLQSYATADNCMEWLISTYGLEDYTAEQARLIAGVRYEMSTYGYTLTTPYTFAEDVSYETGLIIEENTMLYGGAYVEETAVREYVSGDLAPNIIGIVGSMNADEYELYKESGYHYNDRIGKFGIEKQFETELRGVPGVKEITLDSDGNVINVETTQQPIPGQRVYLTIDAELQRVAQRSLAEQITLLRTKSDKYGYAAEGGSAIAVNVKTGELLACANYPTYDLSQYYTLYSEYANDPLTPLYNRALSGLYAPGSCFKPVTAIAALVADTMKANESVFCEKTYTYFADYQPSCMYYHSNINLNRALSLSCNYYFFEAGLRTGVDPIVQFAKKLGLGVATGIELPEKTGRVASPEVREQLGGTWQAGDVLQLAIGQSDSQFTPLQMAMYTAALANNGTRMTAQTVGKLTDYTGEQIVYAAQPTVASETDIPDSVFEAVKKGMISASLTGTGRSQFANYPLSVASKTGTPEIGDGTCNAVFIAYAPADDPEIAVAVVIERGYQGYEAAPIAKAILDHYFGYDVDYSFDSDTTNTDDIQE